MTRYWCTKCNAEHDNARDCPDYQSYGVRDDIVRKQKKDFNRRANKPGNNYKPGKGQSAPKQGCAVVLLVAASVPAVAWWYLA
jgi:hypothetical protein